MVLGRDHEDELGADGLDTSDVGESNAKSPEENDVDRPCRRGEVGGDKDEVMSILPPPMADRWKRVDLSVCNI
jgi:hypothetical protein